MGLIRTGFSANGICLKLVLIISHCFIFVSKFTMTFFFFLLAVQIFRSESTSYSRYISVLITDSNHSAIWWGEMPKLSCFLSRHTTNPVLIPRLGVERHTSFDGRSLQSVLSDFCFAPGLISKFSIFFFFTAEWWVHLSLFSFLFILFFFHLFPRALTSFCLYL